MISKRITELSKPIEKALIHFGYSFEKKEVSNYKTFCMRSYESIWVKPISKGIKYTCVISHGLMYEKNTRSRSIGLSVYNSERPGVFSVNNYIYKKNPDIFRAPVEAKNHNERLEILKETTDALVKTIENDLEELFLGKVWYGTNIHPQD